MTAPGAVLLVGTDVTSRLAVHEICRRASARGLRLLVVTDPPGRLVAGAPPALRLLHRLERGLLHDVVYPTVGRRALADPRLCADLGLLAGTGGVTVLSGARLDDVDTVRRIAAFGGLLALSLRCYQKIPGAVMQLFAEPGRAIVNVHPGDLPRYRGVLTFARSIGAGERTLWYTAHHVTPAWDAGPVVARRSLVPSPRRSVLEVLTASHPVMAEIAWTVVEQALAGGVGPGVAQDERLARYHTHLREDEVEDLEAAGVRLAAIEPALEVLVTRFCPPDGRRALDAALRRRLAADALAETSV